MGESQARNRYTYFASKAREEGFEQIAAIFEETAGNEKEHAEREFKFLEGGEAPEECPACGHPQSYSELLAEKY